MHDDLTLQHDHRVLSRRHGDSGDRGTRRHRPGLEHPRLERDRDGRPPVATARVHSTRDGAPGDLRRGERDRRSAIREATRALRPSRDRHPPTRPSPRPRTTSSSRSSLLKRPTSTRSTRRALAALPDDAARANGIAVGQQAAAAILIARANDGRDGTVTYIPGSGPGVYVPTPPAFLAALSPETPLVQPFALKSASQFRPEAPPSLDSRLWARDYNEIKALGTAGRQHAARRSRPTSGDSGPTTRPPVDPCLAGTVCRKFPANSPRTLATSRCSRPLQPTR